MRSIFHPYTQRNALRRHGSRLQSRSFARWNRFNGSSVTLGIALLLVCLGHIALFIKHADDHPVRARARAVLHVRDRVADCVGSCIPDWSVSQPMADQIKAVPVLAGTDLVNILGGGGGHFHPVVCVSPKACLIRPPATQGCSVRYAWLPYCSYSNSVKTNKRNISVTFSGRGCPSSLVKGAETQRLRVRRDTVHCKVQTESNATSLGGFGRLGPKEDLPL